MKILIVENIAAFGAEFRRIVGILRNPPALVAPIKGCSRRLFRSAIGAEFPFIHRSADALPALLRLFLTAIRAEIAGCNGTARAFPTTLRLLLRFFGTAFRAKIPRSRRSAGALPTVCRRRHLRCLLLLLLSCHIVKILGTHCVPGICRHTEAHKPGHGTRRISRRCFHSVGLCAHDGGSGHAGIPQHGSSLSLLDHFLILFRQGDRAQRNRNHLQAPKLIPFCRQRLVHGIF